MANEVGFRDYTMEEESKYNRRYTAEEHRAWQSMTPEQQKEWDQEIRWGLKGGWFSIL